MPWRLTPGQRHLLEEHGSGRDLVQPRPEGEPALEAGRPVKGWGVPVDVLLALAAMEDLALQGNRVAERVVAKIRADWNISADHISLPAAMAARAGRPLFVVTETPDDAPPG